MIALSVAAVLAVFLLYTSIAGGTTPSLRPSQLAGHTGKVSLVGKVVGPITGDAHAGGQHFLVRDVNGTASVSQNGRLSNPTIFKSPGTLRPTSIPTRITSAAIASFTASTASTRGSFTIPSMYFRFRACP